MEENDESSENIPRARKSQITKPGIVPLPRGSKGAKSLYIRRYGDSFGFVLRHFIIYPPESVAEDDGRHKACGSLYQPMETIFVKDVHENSSAKTAGLQQGDRLLAINGISTVGLTYQQVVTLVTNSPEYLHLLVVPKEDDVLQRFFHDTAHNPFSNQAPTYPEKLNKSKAQQIVSRHISQQQQQQPYRLRVDEASWHRLQQPYFYHHHQQQQQQRQQQPPIAYLKRAHLIDSSRNTSQRSTESVLNSQDRRHQGQQQPQQIYAEIRRPNEVQLRHKSRAVPQVPLYQKMGRRASEGSNLLSVDYSGATSLNLSDGDSEQYLETMNSLPCFVPSNGESLTVPVETVGYRYNTDPIRRESTSSLTSSIAESSKDSITSFDSNSTLTEVDDSARISRVRQSVRQKEEFLRTPVNREFHGRPKKLERSIWPPNYSPISTTSIGSGDGGAQDSFVRDGNMKPTSNNLRHPKNNIERDKEIWNISPQPQNGDISGGMAKVVVPIATAYSPRERELRRDDGMREAAAAPSFEAEDIDKFTRGDVAAAEERRMNPAIHNVQKKAKEFENPSEDSRMDFSRSELARLSKKVLQPNVTERAHEYEIKTTLPEGPRRDQSSTSTTTSGSSASVVKRLQKDSRSLENSGSNSSVSDTYSTIGKAKFPTSGNVLISSGSKYIHCPMPGQELKRSESNETRHFRTRSNSAESWATALDDKESVTGTPPPPQPEPATPDESAAQSLPSPLIPEPVVQLQRAPAMSVTPAPKPSSSSSSPSTPVRPTSLDLDIPQRPARHKANTERLSGEYASKFSDKPVVVNRRNKSTNFGDERSKRPDSYLKATKGDQLSFGSDFSDLEELSPQALKNRYRKWQPSPFWGDIDQLRRRFEEAASAKGGIGSGTSSSTGSLEKDKKSVSPIRVKKIRDGMVTCKILEIEGKRATDRSWKQAFMVLKGYKLYLYKDRHHHHHHHHHHHVQSPLGTPDVPLDQSLASGIDMRSSVVRIAEDYTKRKNVLRVTTMKPCRSEFLIQAESNEEFVDWMKTLHEQATITTETELESSSSSSLNRQQAVPQEQLASSTIQIRDGHLSPLLSNKSVKLSTAGRNRSPTGQSPVSKTRKPSQHSDAIATSPKNKKWNIVKQFRKFNQGVSSPSSPTAPEGSTFGIPIEECLASYNNVNVPRFIEVCTNIIEEKGLSVVGIYRVPGNNASINALTEEINRNFDDIPLEDPKWNDLHVVSSLLKAYLRKMPDSLVTSQLYPRFIKADKIENPKQRMEELRKLVRQLPEHNYHTLKHVILHLKQVSDNSAVNKMEAKNLAIVFAPTIVRPDEEPVVANLVNNMNSQCKIVESLISNADWFFCETDDDSSPPIVPLAVLDNCDEFEVNNQALINNISKCEVFFPHASKEQKEKSKMLSSLFSAAQRKVMGKPSKSQHHELIKDESTNGSKHVTDSKENSNNIETVKSNNIPTTVMDMNKTNKNKLAAEKNAYFNYSTDKDDFYRRIENFKQETEAMLQVRPTEKSVLIDPKTSSHLSSSATNINTNSRLQCKPTDNNFLLKTHSATNVFSRSSPNTNRNSLSSTQYGRNSLTNDVSKYSYKLSGDNNNDNNSISNGKSASNVVVGYSNIDTLDGKGKLYSIRRGSSAENINSSLMDLNSKGGLKKVKYETENDNQRKGSLDSLNTADDDSLLITLTKLMDQKIDESRKEATFVPEDETDDIRYADESPEKVPEDYNNIIKDKNNVGKPNDLYKNPSLHKNHILTTKLKSIEKDNDLILKEAKESIIEKEEDTRCNFSTEDNVPDNERRISVTLLANKISTTQKLKRSESLHKPEISVSIASTKIKRSESFNKTGDKLKRSDSLTKSEKTENNINKRREVILSGRKLKESTKIKRKNGMPDRSIKRRHTVGGTKDLDKVTYMDNKSQGENNINIMDNNKDKGMRTSSPDLSTTRKERFFLEINLIASENMVVALRQHLIGPRPQSFQESSLYAVPLESHV